MSYEKLYQGQTALPKSEVVPKANRKKHVVGRGGAQERSPSQKTRESHPNKLTIHVPLFNRPVRFGYKFLEPGIDERSLELRLDCCVATVNHSFTLNLKVKPDKRDDTFA